MTALTREQLLARKLGHAEVAIDDEGGTVSVRGLNRREAIEVSRIEDLVERDILLCSLGLVDPQLTTDDVRAWFEVDDGGTLERVSRRIGELSRMVEGAGKSGVPAVRKRR